MKRLLFSLILMALLPAMTFAGHVDPSRAQKVAQTFLNNNGAKAAQLTDLSKQAGFNNLYIFTARQGFVVMAADDCVQPVLGYSLTGTFVAENMSTNVRGWLQGYDEEIQYAIDNHVKATKEVSQLWNDLVEGNSKAGRATVVVDALIQSTWDQDPGYNDLCPFDNNVGELTVTGCVATAMAQIMRYWEYPTSGTSSHSYTPSTHPEYGVQMVNYANATYDWSAMPLHTSSAEIAKLMYHCGVSVNMMYGTSGAPDYGSGAYSNDIPYALTTYFRYKTGVSYKQKSQYGNNSWLSLIKTELNAGRPVEYNGSGSGGGHAFVCDGYDSSDYFHFNWGWSGSNDGFYALNNLVPGSGGSGGGSYSFTSDQSAVIGIQPKDCTASAPTDFSVVKEGRNAILSWTLASNADSYSIYRDGVVVANTNSTTYTDSDLSYGTYAYYVKSRDANGAVSAPTSTITVAIEPVPTNLTVTQNGDNTALNWTAPEWCLPSTDEEVLTYGDGSFTGPFGSGTAGSMYIYFGHKYPASMLEANKVIYKVSFYATETGAFQLFIYTSTANNSRPQTQIHTQSITVSSTGWNDIAISEPIEIDPTKDLWVFIYDPEAKAHPMGYNSTVVTNGNYCSWDPDNPTTNVNTQNVLFLIRTCITDGSFFYNLYDNNTSVASNISGTSYTLSNIANNTAHQYTLKTIFDNGETEASNMAGLSLGTASLPSLELNANDKMTVTEGSKLTVSGTLTNDDPGRLVIEDGGQLYTPNDVQGTIQKNIVGYGAENVNTNSGYYLLASPSGIKPEVAVSSGMVGGTVENPDFTGVDLYEFAQNGDDGLEWINMRYGNQFALMGGINTNGCLYANVNDVVLNLTSRAVVPFPATTDDKYVIVPRSTDSGVTFVGWNLIGNPFTCDAYLYSGRDFYRMNATGDAIVLATDNCIKPCEGIFVVAAENDPEPYSMQGIVFPNTANIRFTTTEPGNKAALVNIEVLCEGRQLDVARVRFGEGALQRKMVFNDKVTRLSLKQGGIDCSVARGEGQGEMPISFKASRNGIYTLNVDVQNVDLTYLHLIDNMTGADVDLLANPSYAFDATTSDYESRFKLVFSQQAPEPVEGPSIPFAYFNGNAWTISNEGPATLRVIDIMGRIVSSETIDGNATVTLSQVPGVYMLRLVNGADVKVQKVVVQ